MLAPQVKFVACVLWAVAVGASVTAQMCVNVKLNGHSSSPTYHAFYVSNLGILLGGLMLVPRSVFAPKPWHRPVHCWSLLGGICTLPAFASVPAGMMLGVQIVLLVQLLAMLSTALVFDVRAGRIRLSDIRRLGGFGVVVLGVAVENFFSGGSGGKGMSVTAALLLLTVFVSGVGFAVQAKCNARLARDVGSTARSTAISAVVAVTAGLPVDATLAWGVGVAPRFSLQDWPLWLFVGLQSAFYIGSLSRLPAHLGYTTSYLALLLGKLSSSSVTDALGVTGTRVPFDWPRGFALGLVFAGTWLFASSAGHAAQHAPQPGCTLSSFHPSFVDPEAEELGNHGSVRERAASLRARMAAVHVEGTTAA